MEDYLKKIQKKEDDLKKIWKTNQSTKINLIGCDTIVNSPSVVNSDWLAVHLQCIRASHELCSEQGKSIIFPAISLQPMLLCKEDIKCHPKHNKCIIPDMR